MKKNKKLVLLNKALRILVASLSKEEFLQYARIVAPCDGPSDDWWEIVAKAARNISPEEFA